MQTRGKILTVGETLVNEIHGMLIDHNARIQQVFEYLINEKRFMAKIMNKLPKNFTPSDDEDDYDVGS